MGWVWPGCWTITCQARSLSQCLIPPGIIRATKARYINKNNKKYHIAYLPYIHSTTDHISTLMKKTSIHTIQKPFNEMASHLSTRDRQPLTEKSWVYKIPCSGGKACVGQMGCHLSTRILGTHQGHQTREPVISSSRTSCTDKTQHWLWQIGGHS
jgi:hypothetical protein